MLPILSKLDQVGYWSIEMWGGATFDTCLRFLDENPWDRLRVIKQRCPNTPLQMLTRGQNLIGYHHYSRDIVNRFIKAAHRNGIDVFRVFDALNDVRNVIDSAEALNECGAHFEGAISYTMSPVHTLDSYIEYASELKALGAKSICIKDMAGMLTPYRTERLVKALNQEVGLPVHVHCHYVGGMAPANYIKAAEAGASIVDTASAPLAFGNSQPAVEMIVAALKESEYDTGLDLDLLFEISDYWEEMRIKKGFKRGISTLSHMRVYSHQVPGGMMSNLVSQLEIQKASDRMDEVLKEIPRVRAEVGYPPLVTPMSQIVGTQARLQRAHRQALVGHLQGDEGLHRRLLWQGTWQDRPGDPEGRARRRAAARTGHRSGLAGHHDLRGACRGAGRLGQERGRRSHVRHVPQRGTPVPRKATQDREHQFPDEQRRQHHQGGGLRGHRTDS